MGQVNLDEQRFYQEQGQQIMRTHFYLKGALAVLSHLQAAKEIALREGKPDLRWVKMYKLRDLTGQMAIAQRVSNLRKMGHVIECNKRSGPETAYRLVD